ncbi:MAG: copper amine oxidase N-terminal domain-containing protein, partial [Caldisericia bacterium]|nr:copper amine oxidase N-terminal domain-containing protein [Caldisericia bacterium]
MKYPEDADAIMTAFDQRVYKIKATIRDAQGNLIKGVSNLPGKIGSATDFTRFTPFLVKAKAEGVGAPTTFNHLAVSVTDNVTATMKDVAPMSTYYNTGTQMSGTSMNLEAWGAGCIYNSELASNYYIADFNGDGMIDYKDSLNIDKNGSAIFYVFADSEFGLGGLVGANKATVISGDVAGDTPRSQAVSFNPELRYAPDGKFALDWDALTTTYVPIVKPRIRIYEDKTGQEWGSEFLSSSNYDLVNKAVNVLVVKISPSSNLETDPIAEGSIVELSAKVGNKSVTEETKRDPNDEISTYATLHFEPSMIGESNVSLRYKSKTSFSDDFVESDDVLTFDTVKGAVINVEHSGVFYPGLVKKVTVNVEYAGSYGKPLVGVAVSVKGAGVNMEAETNPEGQVEFDVLPSKPGKIVIRLLGEYKTVNPEVIDVIAASEAPAIEFEEYEKLTRKTEMTIVGKTTPDASLSVGGKPISVSADGKFFLNVELVEGKNEFKVVSFNPVGSKTETILVITRDTLPPGIKITPPMKMDTVGVSEVELTIEVNEKVTLTIAGKTLELEAGVSKVMIPINTGDNRFDVQAVDQIGNKTDDVLNVRGYRLKTIELKIDNPVMLVDGEIVMLDTAPYISSANRTLVPVRAISQAFGAEVGWDKSARRVTVELEGIKLSMVIGQKTAVLNGEFVTIEQPPEIVNGRTMVPFRFIAESLGAEISWNGEERL